MTYGDGAGPVVGRVSGDGAADGGETCCCGDWPWLTVIGTCCGLIDSALSMPAAATDAPAAASASSSPTTPAS